MLHSLSEDNINEEERRIALIDCQLDGKEVTLGYITRSEIVLCSFGKVIRYDQEDAFDLIDTSVSLVELLDPGDKTIKDKPYQLVFHSKYYTVIFTRLHKFELRGINDDNQIKVEVIDTGLHRRLLTTIYNKTRLEYHYR